VLSTITELLYRYLMTFKGFTDSESFTQLPDSFFQTLLAEIDDPAELKVTLFFLWQVQHMEGPYRALRQADFDEKALGLPADEVAAGLEKAARRGSILEVEHEADGSYFLNSPRGRAAAEAFAKGKSGESGKTLAAPMVEQPEPVQAVRGKYRSADADDRGHVERRGGDLFAGVGCGSAGNSRQKKYP
jgi:hypothetical protein